MKAGELNPQLRQHRAQQAFARSIAKLWLELRAGTERRHLDVLCELCEAFLAECGKTQLTQSYRAELDTASAQALQRSHLRLIK
jgi:hypothetical protein